MAEAFAAEKARMRKRRESVLEVEPGKTVTVRRPGEVECLAMQRAITLDDVCQHVVGWSGITEADLYGADQAPTDAATFAPELWRELVVDRAEWYAKVITHLRDSIVSHFAAKDAAAKN